MNLLKIVAKSLPVIRQLVFERDQLVDQNRRLATAQWDTFAKTLDYFMAKSKGCHSHWCQRW